jgi:hypothetical protein
MFTKHFVNKDKWEQVCGLIGVITGNMFLPFSSNPSVLRSLAQPSSLLASWPLVHSQWCSQNWSLRSRQRYLRGNLGYTLACSVPHLRHPHSWLELLVRLRGNLGHTRALCSTTKILLRLLHQVLPIATWTPMTISCRATSPSSALGPLAIRLRGNMGRTLRLNISLRLKHVMRLITNLKVPRLQAGQGLRGLVGRRWCLTQMKKKNKNLRGARPQCYLGLHLPLPTLSTLRGGAWIRTGNTLRS